MDRGRPQRDRPLAPVALAGLLLLLLGATILAAGVWLFPGNALGLEAWVAAVGLLLLVGALVAMRLFRRAPEVRERPFPTSVTGPPIESSPAAPATPSLVPEPGLTDSAAPPPPEPAAAVRPVSSSIPGAYLAAIDTVAREELPPWGESPPPIAAALPFAAMPRPPEGRSGSAEGPETSAVLEVELARLRARLRELESEGPPAPVNGPRLGVSGGSRGLPPLRPSADLGRPTPPAAALGRFCAGCGTTVTPSGSPTRCSSCGRLLCTTCAGRATLPSGFHYCPACAPRRRPPPSLAISGGRAGVRISPGDVSRPGDDPPAAPR